MTLNMRRALLAGTAIVAVGAFAVTGANAQTAITTDTDLDGAAVGALTNTDNPVVTIDSAAVTLSSNYAHTQTANENLINFITSGPSSFTINDGITLSSDGTGDLILTTGDLSGISVNVNGVLTASANTQDAINFASLGATNGATITINGGAGTDGNVTGVITGGAGADTLTVNLADGNSTIDGAIDLGAESDTIALTGAGILTQSGAVTNVESITLASGATLNSDAAITATAITVATGTTLDQGAGLITANVANAGTIQFTGTGGLAGNVTGAGALDVDANTTITGNVAATSADIANAAVLTVDAGAVDTGTVSIGTVTMGDADSGLTLVSNATTGTTTFTGNIVGDNGDGDLLLGNNAAEAQAYVFNGNIGSATDDRIDNITLGGADAAVVTGTINGNVFADDIIVGNGDTLTMNGTSNVNSFAGSGAGAGTVNVGNGTDASTVTATGVVGTTGLAAVNVANNSTLVANNNIVATAIGINGALTVGGASTWTGATTVGADGAATINVGNVITLGGGMTIGDGAGDTAELVFNQNAGFDPDATTGIVGGGNAITFTADTVTTVRLGSSEATSQWISGDTVTFIDGATGSNINTALGDGRIVFDTTSLLTLTDLASDGDTLAATVGYANAATVFGAGSTGASVANALLAMGADGDANLDAIRSELLNLTGSAAQARAESLAPTVDGAFVAAGAQSTDLTFNVVNDRLEIARAGGVDTGMVAGEMGDGVTVWGKGFGQLANQDRREGVAGYDADTYGAAIGIDSENMIDNGLVGMSFSYANTDIESENVNSTDTDVDGYQVSLYGSKGLNDGMYVSGMLGYTMGNIDQTRYNVNGVAGNNAKADFDSDQYSAYAEFGRDYDANGMTVTPKVLVNYAHMEFDGYTETGSTANLTVATDDVDVLELGVGVKAAWNFDDNAGNTITPSLSAEYRYDVIGDEVQTTSNFTGGGAAFQTQGFDPAQSSFMVGTGVAYDMDNVTISADYGYQLKEDYDAHNLSVRAGVNF